MTTIKIILVVALAAAALIGCSEDDDEPSAEGKFMEQLAGHWTLAGGSVKLDHVDVGGAFASFELTIVQDRTYTSTDAVSPIWLSHGSFTLIKNNAGLFNLLRNDGTLIEITALTAHSLQFNQQYEVAAGRVSGVSGRYYFSMTR